MEVYLKHIGFKQMDELEPTEFHKDQAACFRIIATK